MENIEKTNNAETEPKEKLISQERANSIVMKIEKVLDDSEVKDLVSYFKSLKYIEKQASSSFEKTTTDYKNEVMGILVEARYDTKFSTDQHAISRLEDTVSRLSSEIPLADFKKELEAVVQEALYDTTNVIAQTAVSDVKKRIEELSMSK